MVSGFFTSPKLQLRIVSAAATVIFTWSKPVSFLSAPKSSWILDSTLIIFLAVLDLYKLCIQLFSSSYALVLDSSVIEGALSPTLTSRHRLRISLIKTLKDSGVPASRLLSPLTIDS